MSSKSCTGDETKSYRYGAVQLNLHQAPRPKAPGGVENGLRDGPRRTVQQLLDRLERRGKIRPENGAENQAGVDGDEYEPPALSFVPRPRCAFRDCLCPIIRESVVAVRLVGPIRSVKGFSRTPRPNMTAEIADVITTRFTPASRAALSTRRVPSRAGRTSSSSDFGSTVGTGDAAWST
jgi:hypothetical protein